MAGFALVQGILIYATLLWKLVQLVRAPRDVPLRIVTICLACAGAAYPFEIATNNAKMTQRTAGSMPMMWAQDIFLMLLVYSLICFFVFTALERRQARVQAGWQAIPLLVTIAVATGIAVSVPITAHPSAYPPGTVATYFLVTDTYKVYGFLVALVWVRRHARSAGPRLKRGLNVTSLGLVSMVLATCLLEVAVAIRWANGSVPPFVLTATICLLLPGIVLFIAGICYPGLAVRLAALRIWWRHLRSYRQLRTLWTVLHEAFPQDALNRTQRGHWRDALSLHGVHRKHYRRVIECRDGLVRISPYMNPIDTKEDLAGQVEQALRRHAEGTPSFSSPRPIAAPAVDGLDADVDELVRLSLALHTR